MKKLINQYLNWVESLTPYQYIALILILLLIGSVWAIFIKLMTTMIERT